MSRVPIPASQRLAVTIKNAVSQVALHAQQIVALKSATGQLLPGDWETITLEAGWSPLPGYIPPQVRILQNGMSQLIGHIQNGTTTDGTVIGVLTSGFFNPTHAHTFTVNSVTGASAVSHPGALNNINGQVNGTTQIPVSDHTFSLSGSNFASGSVHMGPSSGNQFSNAATSSSTTLNDGSSATNVNMNSPVITLDTSGNLTITNVDPNVDVLSFSELIPLVTA